jgi:hypothetical protein
MTELMFSVKVVKTRACLRARFRWKKRGPGTRALLGRGRLVH